MVVIGDFAPGVVTDNPLEPVTGYNVFTFPSINGSGPVVVGGGDLFVNFKTSEAATAFLEYLTTPDAAEIWAKPRRVLVAEQERRRDRLPGRDHADERDRARRMRRTFRFDMSDLQPSAFGGTPGQGLFKDVHGLRGEARRRRRGHAADGGRREEGVQQLGVRARL